MEEILGKIGCRFMSNIENHIKDYKLMKEDDVEWLLEPLDAISHSADIVLDAFQYGTHWESFYQLYIHFKNAKSVYKPYDLPPESRLLSDINNGYIAFDDETREIPEPKPYDRSMLIQDKLDIWSTDEIPSIWDELTVPFTEVGIWQAVLLNEIRTLFPKGWHANYLRKTYVFSREDMQQIVNDKSRYDYTDEEIEKLNAYWKLLDMNSNFDQHKKSNYDRLVSYLDREDILPSVEISGDKAVASYYYWNDWSGFCRRCVPVERYGHSVSIGKPNNEVLIAYNCGIRY